MLVLATWFKFYILWNDPLHKGRSLLYSDLLRTTKRCIYKWSWFFRLFGRPAIVIKRQKEAAEVNESIHDYNYDNEHDKDNYCADVVSFTGSALYAVYTVYHW